MSICQTPIVLEVHRVQNPDLCEFLGACVGLFCVHIRTFWFVDKFVVGPVQTTILLKVVSGLVEF